MDRWISVELVLLGDQADVVAQGYVRIVRGRATASHPRPVVLHIEQVQGGTHVVLRVIAHYRLEAEISIEMSELLFDGTGTMEGIVATLYTAAWAFAELRERLKRYEATRKTPDDLLRQMVTPFENDPFSMVYLIVLMLRANGNVGQLMGEGLGLDVDWMLCKDKYLWSAAVGREVREAILLLMLIRRGRRRWRIAGVEPAYDLLIESQPRTHGDKIDTLSVLYGDFSPFRSKKSDSIRAFSSSTLRPSSRSAAAMRN